MTETAGPDCRLRELARLRVNALSLSPLATATAEPRTIEARVVSPLAVAPLTRAESTRTDVRRSAVSLFDAFYTTKSGGTRIGLVSRSLVERYQRRLWAEPKWPGATFFVFCSVLASAASKLPRLRAPKKRPRSTGRCANTEPQITVQCGALG